LKQVKLFHKLEETTALNVSIEPLKTMGCGSRFQSDIARGKTDYCLWWILQGKWKRRSACDCLRSGLILSCLAIATLSFAILYTRTNQAYLHLSSRLCQFKWSVVTCRQH